METREKEKKYNTLIGAMSFNQRDDFYYSSNDPGQEENISKVHVQHSDFDNNRSSSNHPNNHIGSQREKELFKLLNSSKPRPQKAINVPPPNTKITDEDVAFLKAASEVVKMHQNHVDSTIRDILNRLQYSNSPHGGLPISRQYLQSIDREMTNDDQEQDFQNSSNIVSSIPMDNQDNTNYVYENGDNSVTNTTTSSVPIQNNDLFINQHHEVNNFNHHDGHDKLLSDLGNSPTNFIIPPFTENPLRNPPTNLDFPQFSLDIFKPNEDASYTQLENTNHLRNGGAYRSRQTDNDVEMVELDHEDRDGEEDEEEEYEEYEEEDNNFSDSGHLHKRRKSQTSNNKDNPDNIPRNFKCSECPISFKRSSDLKRHEKIHLKTPPNICPQCHKGFARRDALKRHVGTLTCKRNRQRRLEQMKENGEVLT